LMWDRVALDNGGAGTIGLKWWWAARMAAHAASGMKPMVKEETYQSRMSMHWRKWPAAIQGADPLACAVCFLHRGDCRMSAAAMTVFGTMAGFDPLLTFAGVGPGPDLGR
jgi:hypothetical protein